MDNWEITKICPIHSCTIDASIQHHRQLDFKVIANLIYSYMYNKHTSIRVWDLQQFVTDMYAQTISYRKVWYAKHKVIEKIF